MPSIRRLSVWDRLLAPAHRVPRLESVPEATEVEECIRRDLEDLFRTRTSWREYLEGAAGPGAASILDYGLPDFSNLHLGPEQLVAELKRGIEDALACHETRLINPVVEVKEISEGSRSVTFGITASIAVGNQGHEVLYRTEIDFDGRVEVRNRGI